MWSGSKVRSTKRPHGCEVFLLKCSSERTLRQKDPRGVKSFCRGKVRSTKRPHGCEVFLLKCSSERTLRQKDPTGVKCFCIVFLHQKHHTGLNRFLTPQPSTLCGVMGAGPLGGGGGDRSVPIEPMQEREEGDTAADARADGGAGARSAPSPPPSSCG